MAAVGAPGVRPQHPVLRPLGAGVKPVAGEVLAHLAQRGVPKPRAAGTPNERVGPWPRDAILSSVKQPTIATTRWTGKEVTSRRDCSGMPDTTGAAKQSALRGTRDTPAPRLLQIPASFALLGRHVSAAASNAALLRAAACLDSPFQPLRRAGAAAGTKWQTHREVGTQSHGSRTPG